MMGACPPVAIASTIGFLIMALPLACRKGGEAQTGTVKQNREIPMTATSSDDLRALAAEIKIVFPPSARLIGIARERGIDDLVEAKVELSGVELPLFFSVSPVKGEALEPDRLDLLGTDHSWWDPGRAKNLRAAQVLVGKGKVFNLGVAEGATGIVVLYLVQHGT